MSVTCTRLGRLEPVEAAMKLYREPGFVWLDSASSAHASARYSYLGVRPVSRFRWDIHQDTSGFEAAFRTWLQSFTIQTLASEAPFQGGAMGYLSYEAAGLWIDRFASRHQPASETIAEFGYYDTIIAFDHETGEASLFSAQLDGETGKHVLDLLAGDISITEDTRPGWHPSSGQMPYSELVRAAQDEILDGEIYQANLARLWVSEPASISSAFADFLRVKRETHAPCAAFGTFAARTISCFSPERLVSMSADGRVRAEPIKGTGRRSSDPAEDAALADALTRSEKDRAENIMIVDLLRNDLSRVCEPHSVMVRRLCGIESLPNLHHLVSTIEGDLRAGSDAVDLLGAVFPGGSITGCPKLRAMEIIDRLEPASRGAFCGSLGYIGHDGACDFNIMIRTIDHLPSGSRYWSGAGITLLSDPAAETDEIDLKAERILAPVRPFPGAP